MLLAIDAGNSRIKAAIFDPAGQIFWQITLPNHLITQLDIPSDFKVHRVMIANVAGKAHAEHLQKILIAHGLEHILWVKSKHLACGVKNNYAQPEQLGVDRWAALIAAWQRYQCTCLVVNIGTAVTIDILQRSEVETSSYAAEFLGGMIVPGLHLMQLALTQHTADLNWQEGQNVMYPINTADAISSGIHHAILGAIRLNYERLPTNAMVILSGGDAGVLVEYLKAINIRVVLEPNLVLQGLRLLEKVA